MKNLNQKGQGMTEYILIVALIAVAVIGAVKYFGSTTKKGFSDAAGNVSNALDAGSKASSDPSNSAIK